MQNEPEINNERIRAEIAELKRLRELCSLGDIWEKWIDARLKWLREKLTETETET